MTISHEVTKHTTLHRKIFTNIHTLYNNIFYLPTEAAKQNRIAKAIMVTEDGRLLADQLTNEKSVNMYSIYRLYLPLGHDLMYDTDVNVHVARLGGRMRIGTQTCLLARRVD